MTTTATVNYENLLDNLSQTRTAAEEIHMSARALPAEFREKADVKMSELASMQVLVLNFARLEVERIDTLQRITLSQMQTRGNA